MNKKIIRIISVVLALVLVFSSLSVSMAAPSGSADAAPLKVTISTDKSSYRASGVVNFNVTVANISNETVNKISAEALFDGFAPIGSESVLYAETEELEAGKSFSFNFKAIIDTNKVSVNFFTKIILFFTKLFNGSVYVGENDFNDGRACLSETKDVIMGSYEISQSVNVYYEKPVATEEFVLESSKKEVQANDATLVYFYAYAPEGTSEVILYNGADEEIGEMYDDGLFSTSGDDMQQDGVYTRKVVIESAESTYTAYAKAINSEGVISNSSVVEIMVFEPLTDEEINEMDEVDETVTSIIDSYDFDEMTEDEKIASVEDVLNDFGEEGMIEKNSIEYDEESGIINFEYECGVLGGVMISDFGDEFNGRSGQIASENAVQNTSGAADAQAIDSTVSFGNATMLFSFNGSGDSASFRQPFYYNTKEDWDSKGLSTNVDWQVTVEDMKNLDKGYDVICISGHGSTYKNQPVICLTEKATAETQRAYSADLKQNRIAKVNLSGGAVYWVFPSFIENAYDSDDLEGAFVFSECCNFFGEDGDYTEAFSNAFLSSGVSALVGFHNSVKAIYCREFMKEWIDSLISGSTARDAFDAACSMYGANDGGNPAAIAQFRGDETARFVDTGLKNGSFELANYPSKWSSEGDVRVITGLGGLAPQHGSRMAVLTTGIGSKESSYLAGTEGSILQQTFIVPEGMSTISFVYDVVSEEPMEYVGSGYDDKYIVQLFDKNGNVIEQVAFESVNTSTWTPISGINFDGGDSTTYHTGWKNASADISAYQNEAITIRFVVYDVGDSIYDTAALVDDVKLS